jgi:hypothetical protein
MTSASSLAFPGSRTLATWWRQLDVYKPQSLCAGYLFVHRLEAPAIWRQQQPLDPFLLLVLEALSLEQKDAAPQDRACRRLSRRLHLDVPILRHALHSLAALELIGSPAAAPETAWRLTDPGQDALRDKRAWARIQKRGTFSFVERLDPTGQRRAAPHYLKIAAGPASPWHVEPAAAFDAAWLRACQDQAPEWKDAFGWPAELVAFDPAAPPSETAPRPDQVVLDRTERLLVVLLQGSNPADELLGFGVRAEGWLLHAAEPIFRLPTAARSLFPEASASLDVWQQAWRSWCQSRSFPAVDVKECTLSLVEERLRVEAPEHLIRALQAGKGDFAKTETWLLAGDGYLRHAARLEIVARQF